MAHAAQIVLWKNVDLPCPTPPNHFRNRNLGTKTTFDKSTFWYRMAHALSALEDADPDVRRDAVNPTP